MKLSYKAVSKTGKTMTGIIEAKDVDEAASFLRAKEFIPIKIGRNTESDLRHFFPFLNKVKSIDVVFFTRQLSSMLASGLTLMQSLNILKDQIQSEQMTTVVNGIILDIEEGKSLSAAITKYPEVFTPIYVSLVKASEASGLLDKVLVRLSDNLEKQEKLKSSIKSALMYPIIVVIAMILATVVMMIFVVPQLTNLYSGLNVELPLPTRIVIGISNFMVAFWPLVIGGFFLGLFLFKRWRKTPAGKIIVDDFVLKIPIFGKLIKQSILSEFARTLGLLIGSGTLVVDALRQTADVAGNELYKNAILGIEKKLEKGVGMGDSMLYSTLFPPILVQMAKIGEQTGKLDESLLRVSDYFERETEQTIKTLTTAMEPLIMVVLGIGVAFLVISIITPIYNLTNVIN